MLAATLGRAGAPLTILCLGAHCDDLEIGAGGTIMRLMAEHPGSTVHWVVFTASANPIRQEEARGSAAELLAPLGERAHYHQKAFRESFFPAEWTQIKVFFEELKSAVEPDVVLTHHRRDLHQDHRIISELSLNSFRDHVIAEFEIPKYDADLGVPNLYVPLTQTMAQRKIEMLMRHFASQRGRRWFKPETYEGIMRIRGIECNAPEGYAEAFHVRKLIL
jgi:LmbE family N-acetylglucosaminyl deacetylase